MNIEKIKEFISLRADLLESGVIGFNAWEDEVQVRDTELIKEPDLKLEFRDSDEYPYEIYVIRDGIKVCCVLSKEKLQRYYPQFTGYMVEDVKLDGMKEGEDYAS